MEMRTFLFEEMQFENIVCKISSTDTLMLLNANNFV